MAHNVTQHELRIILLVATGAKQDEVASQLGFGNKNPVVAAIRNMKAKFGARTTEQLIVFLLRERIIRGNHSKAPMWLDNREMIVLRELSDGALSYEICRRHHLNPKTLVNIINSILYKFGAVSRENAMFLGYCYGLISQRWIPPQLDYAELDALSAITEVTNEDDGAALLKVDVRVFAQALRTARGKLHARDNAHAVALALHRKDLLFESFDGSERFLVKVEEYILVGIASGQSNAAIARGLGMREREVSDFVTSACLKLGAMSREQAMLRMFQYGWIR